MTLESKAKLTAKAKKQAATLKKKEKAATKKEKARTQIIVTRSNWIQNQVRYVFDGLTLNTVNTKTQVERKKKTNA